MIDQIYAFCSKIGQFILCILFSDHGPNERINNNLLGYFSQDSLWLDQLIFSTINPNVHISNRPTIDLKHLPIWRFTIRRRKTNRGICEYYSDIELDQSNNNNEQDCRLKKSFIHRRITGDISLLQQDNCYTSESDENNNSLKTNLYEMNSSKIYQCSICLEKYIFSVYVCTLPCLHHFHRKCLFDWLCTSETNTCPLCRSPVMN